MPQLSPELLNTISEALVWVVVVLTATLVALWVSLAVWAFRDIRSRTGDVFAWLLAGVLVLVAGPFGLLLYFLLRPHETLAQSYDRQLEEEALLRDIQARRACPKCRTVTEPEWLLCPHCQTKLRLPCENCGRPLELDWKACPFCAVPARGREAEVDAIPLLSTYSEQDSEPEDVLPLAGGKRRNLAEAARD